MRESAYLVLRILVQALLANSIPSHDSPIAATGRKSTMQRMECDCIHRIDVLRPVLYFPVALERVLLRLLLLLLTEILDRDSPLYGGHRITQAIGETSHASRLVLEKGLSLDLRVPWIKLPRVVDVDLPLGHRDHEPVSVGIHAEHFPRH